MTTVHDFILVLNEMIDERFPDTERYVVFGGDHIKDHVLELRQGGKKLRYSPYEMYQRANGFEETIEHFIAQWEAILQQE